jgi:hypothetical protein
MARCAHALPSTLDQNNISPLYAECDHCARVTMKQIPPRECFLFSEYLLCRPVA